MTSKNGVHIEAGPDTESSADSYNFTIGLSGKVRKPRSKVSKACDNCRKRKIKCNGKFPCASCEIYSCECTFTTRQGGNRIKNLQKANLEGTIVQGKEETDSSSTPLPKPQPYASRPYATEQPAKFSDNFNLDGRNSADNNGSDGRNDDDVNRNGFYEDDSDSQATLTSLQNTLKNLKEMAHLGTHITSAIESVESQMNDLIKRWEPKVRVKDFATTKFYPNKSIETQLMKNKYCDVVHLTRYAAWSNNKKDQDTSSQPLIDEIFGLYSPFQFLSLQGIGKCFQNYRSKSKCEIFPRTAKETIYIMLRFFDVCFHHINQGCVSIANPLENYLQKMNLLPSTPSSISSAGSPNTAHTKSHVALVINHLPQPFVKRITGISNAELLSEMNNDTSMFGILLKMLHQHKNSYQNFLMEITSNPPVPKNTHSKDVLEELIHYCQAGEALIALCYSYYNSTLYNYVDFTCDITHLEQLLYFLDLLFWLSEVYGFEKVLNVAVHFVSRVGLSRWEFYVGLDETFAERRRNLWWKAFYFEKTLASKMGYPSNIDDSKINCLLPKDFRDVGFLDNRDFIENVHLVHRNEAFDNMSISSLKDYGELAVLQIVSHFSSSVLFNEKFTSIRNTSKPSIVREKLLFEVLEIFNETEMKYDAIKKQTGKLFDIAFSKDTSKLNVSREDKIIASRFVLFYEHHFCRMVNESDNIVARLCVHRRPSILIENLQIYLYKIYKSWTDMNTILLDFDNDYFVYRSFTHYSISCIILVTQAFSVAEFINVNDVLDMIKVFKRFLDIKIFSENETNEHVSNSQSFKDYTRAFSFLTIVTRIMLLAYGESSSTNLDVLSKYVEENAPDLKGIIELVLDTNSCAYRFLLEPVQKSGFHLTVSQMLKRRQFQVPSMSNEDKEQIRHKTQENINVGNSSSKIGPPTCLLNGIESPRLRYHGRSAPSPMRNPSLPEFAQLPSFRSLSVSDMINPDYTQSTGVQNSTQIQANKLPQSITGQQQIPTPIQVPFMNNDDMGNDDNNNNNNINNNNNNNNNNSNNFSATSFNLGTLDEFVNNGDLEDLYSILWSDVYPDN
ncbi:hypothetical protein SMKI_07G2360 [Saccharomyces mikatae IFO 1815]|uniref:Zn(2)-C6 fungal-type domain-containing protein n=1 Tax=Saccharomyces mikatae IFO 1815 TaxID=226126 RepID=A0AA35NIH3_SACMI|nr:uncharacterized protein SMKI_07G2360 [Saccharomyces mikatae IFO 1815]CAI4039255.1 hypothetical protein SMKI_07G2360 [Saccharomyces mikatae IFO 1815]